MVFALNLYQQNQNKYNIYMKNQLKKLAPFALVGILSGATTFGAINYFNEEQNNPFIF